MKYSWFIVLYKILPFNKIIQLYIYIHTHSFAYALPLWFIIQYWIQYEGLEYWQILILVRLLESNLCRHWRWTPMKSYIQVYKFLPCYFHINHLLITELECLSRFVNIPDKHTLCNYSLTLYLCVTLIKVLLLNQFSRFSKYFKLNTT